MANLLIIPIAIGSKAIGTFIGGTVTGFKPRESTQLAVGMMPRAEIVIIIAEIGLLNGIFTQDIFSMAILLVLVTVLITPLLLKLVFREKKVLDGLVKRHQIKRRKIAGRPYYFDLDDKTKTYLIKTLKSTRL